MPSPEPQVPLVSTPNFASRRSAVMGVGGVVATGQPLAAQAGLRIMQDGGNAFDAAVSTAAMLTVTEPTGTGLGGDCFALLYVAATGTVHALNGSGRSPRALDRDVFGARGLTRMPARGALTVTVPGAVDAWAAMLAAHGRMRITDVLAPAISAAESGYPVTERIAAAWQAGAEILATDPHARRHLLFDGRAPRSGEVVRLPALARSLRRIAEGGRDAFYRGPIAQAIAAATAEAGGFLSVDDLAAHRSEWVEPIAATYRGLRVWECPPNSQGLAALLALAIADGFDLSAVTWGSAAHLHPLIEAMRLAFADAGAHVADPDACVAPLGTLLSADYAAHRRALLRPDVALDHAPVGLPVSRDTVYVATIDAEGNACSFIQSNYMGFGSGLVAGDTGIALQNRGAGFTLEAGHPNSYAPGRRPFHTIIPALVTRADGTLWAVLGVMGGHMQPQGHLQLLVNLAAFGMDPQRALDAPRFMVTPDDRVALEPALGSSVRTALARRGHRLVELHETPSSSGFGGGQVIAVTPEGVRIAGSDPRKDGQAAAT